MKGSTIAIAVALASVTCKKSGSHAPAGPAPAWRATIDKDAYDAVVSANATLVTVGKAGVAAVRDGKQAWTRALEAEPSGWLVALGTDAVLAGDDKGTVYAIAASDGSVKWTAKTPAFDEGSDDRPSIAEGAATGDRIVLLDSSMRFLVLDPAACARGDACMTPSGQLSGGATAEEIHLMPDGTRVLSEYKWVALFSATGERIASLSADDLIGGVAITPTHVVVAHDQGVSRIAPARCKVEDGKFRLGKREDREDPPPGCVEHVHIGPTEIYPPIVSPRGTAWIDKNDEIVGRGAASWKIGMERVHPGSSLVADGDRGYVACWVEPEGSDLFVTIADLCAFSLETGKLLWRSKLGLRRAGIMASPWIEIGSGMIFVVVNDTVAALPLNLNR